MRWGNWHPRKAIANEPAGPLDLMVGVGRVFLAESDDGKLKHIHGGGARCTRILAEKGYTSSFDPASS
jgi:hypothetical protein